jgi:hypothetical protein
LEEITINILLCDFASGVEHERHRVQHSKRMEDQPINGFAFGGSIDNQEIENDIKNYFQ